MKNEKCAVFGAGCFWGVEEHFRKLKGVEFTEVGYMGGNHPDPTYKEVCTGRTGHAEVLKVVFNPVKISYKSLLKEFWACHDPTTKNAQGPDVGTQYRSVLFYFDPSQKQEADETKAALEQSGIYIRAIVTEIEQAGNFYRAEEYHQQYIAKCSQQG